MKIFIVSVLVLFCCAAYGSEHGSNQMQSSHLRAGQAQGSPLAQQIVASAVGSPEFEAWLKTETPEWFSQIPQRHRDALIEHLRDIFLNINPRLFDLEKRYRLLEFCRYWIDSVSEHGGWNAIPADVFGISVASDYAKYMSDANIYDKLIKEGVLDPTAVHEILDLGCGYWNYAHILPHVFPELRHAVGIEPNTQKVMDYEKITAPSFGIDTSRLTLLQADMRELENNEQLQAGIQENGKFDLVLLQNPQTNFDKSTYIDVFSQVSRVLAPGGHMVIVIDDGRLRYDGNPALLDSLSSISFTRFEDIRIPNITHEFSLHSGTVGVYVISQPELSRLVK